MLIQVLPNTKKVNNISLINFQGIKIHDKKFFHSISVYINDY